MNKKQFNRYEVILRTIDGSLTIEDAAASLNLSARQVKRIKKEVISDGPAALAARVKIVQVKMREFPISNR